MLTMKSRVQITLLTLTSKNFLASQMLPILNLFKESISAFSPLGRILIAPGPRVEVFFVESLWARLKQKKSFKKWTQCFLKCFSRNPLGLYFVSTTVPPPNYPVYTSSVRRKRCSIKRIASYAAVEIALCCLSIETFTILSSLV
jgi:hypothetical protein